ncbi:MAG: hypothetical protein WCD53_04740 [Microcoleus sp.]
MGKTKHKAILLVPWPEVWEPVNYQLPITNYRLPITDYQLYEFRLHRNNIEETAVPFPYRD